MTNKIKKAFSFLFRKKPTPSQTAEEKPTTSSPGPERRGSIRNSTEANSLTHEQQTTKQTISQRSARSTRQEAKNARHEAQKERRQARFARYEAGARASKAYRDFSRRIFEVLTVEEYGKMLRRLKELGSLEALQQLIDEGNEFPEFTAVWKDNPTGLKLDRMLDEYMLDAEFFPDSEGGHVEGSEMGLLVWVATRPDRLPILPPALQDLPWFRTAIEEQIGEIVLDCKRNSCLVLDGYGTLGPILNVCSDDDIRHLSFTAGHNVDNTGQYCTVFNKYDEDEIEKSPRATVIYKSTSHDMAVLEVGGELDCVHRNIALLNNDHGMTELGI
ncbi:hypothetical protein H072_11349 [Dactylellina haptotyla CBS 200.50]|uniref:Uncharacterized protein n=1 Tax=Dactylellina haptotyla (strain CBS 200.50) TaxID=1284197 RepID=S7ZXY5_DACHA|nr:hypothetical protein H072_11349 [Dactylellina haptotyla CBS 200.50]